MPVQKKGFLFTYFEKAVCAVVALGLLLAVVYAVRRAGVMGRVAPVEPVLVNIESIEQGGKRPPAPIPKKDLLEEIIGHLEAVTAAGTLPPLVFYPLRSQVYTLARVGTEKEFTLTFGAPLKEGSVTVEGEEPIVTLLEHPVDENYRRVRLVSGSEEGLAMVVGKSGNQRHAYPVEVDVNADKTALPPARIAVVSTQRPVVLRIEHNPQNEDQEVEVLHYEIWRRDWVDPLGDYHKVGNAAVTAAARAGAAIRGPRFGGTIGPGGRAMAPVLGRAGTTAEAAAVRWQDNDVLGGRTYSYKARTVGSNTYPAASEKFTEAVLVEVSPDVDFRFARFMGEKVGCDVVKLFPDGIRQHTFWVSVGQEIGGIIKDPDTGQARNYLTGAVLVDFHRAVILPGVGVTDRMVFADAEGNLRIRLRKDEKSELWQLEEASRRVGPGLRAGPIGVPAGIPGVPTGARGPTGGARRGLPRSGGQRRR